MLTVATMLWDANAHTRDFSLGFDEAWVEKLYRGFRRNLVRTKFAFVCYTDRQREFEEPIYQRRIKTKVPEYGCYVEPFADDGPMILVGLDTVIVGQIDHMADYARQGNTLALPRDPYAPERSINAVAIIPPGNQHVATSWRGENDMVWLRRFHCKFIDDLWPGQVLSLKAHMVRDRGLQGARIVYCHGKPKPHELGHLDWVREHWR
jgi:hypothetical protein